MVQFRFQHHRSPYRTRPTLSTRVSSNDDTNPNANPKHDA